MDLLTTTQLLATAMVFMIARVFFILGLGGGMLYVTMAVVNAHTTTLGDKS